MAEEDEEGEDHDEAGLFPFPLFPFPTTVTPSAASALSTSFLPTNSHSCPTAIARKAASDPAAAAGLEPGGRPAKGAGGSEAESSPRRFALRAEPTALAAADSGDAGGGGALLEESELALLLLNSTDAPSDIATLAATTAATAAAAGGHTAATGVLVGGKGPSSPAIPLEAAADDARACVSAAAAPTAA